MTIIRTECGAVLWNSPADPPNLSFLTVEHHKLCHDWRCRGA